RLATNPTLFPYTTLFRSVIDGLGELTEVEKAQFDARRYLGISSRELLSYTPREFAIEMKAETERIYDEMEREAIIAIMHANANNSKKRIRPSDLFKRPNDETEKKSADDVKKRQKERLAWLSRFEEFNHLRKEV